jgi:hypothetical protein
LRCIAASGFGGESEKLSDRLIQVLEADFASVGQLLELEGIRDISNSPTLRPEPMANKG